MTILHSAGSSIEAAKAHLKTRKFNPLRPIKNDVHGLVFRFKLSRNSSAEVSKELAPKRSVENDASLIDLGDKISASVISGFSTNPVPDPVIKKGSATHKAQFIECSGFVFSTIEIALAGY